MPNKSGGTVLLALGANAAVAVAKISAGLLGGSSVMWAKAGHSVSDTFNQPFLYTSLRRSGKEPTRQHPFGYGADRFFWALIAAVGIFVAGAGFSLYEANRAFTAAPTVDSKTKLSPDPSVKTVVSEDSVAIIGMCWVSLLQQLSMQRNSQYGTAWRH